MKQFLITLALFVRASCSFLFSESSCMSPSPSSNFTNAKYNGLWYEIGKMQTAGGAFFEKDCVCTTIDIKPQSGATNGDSTAINSCRKLSPTGSFLNATGALTGEVVPGHWKEGFFFLAPKADYTVIYLDDDYAIEYDCSSLLSTNYCIHLLARKPTADAAAVKRLLAFADLLNLNTDKLSYKPTLQAGCW